MKSIEEWLDRPGGLARQLREVRRGAGLTGTRVAQDLGWNQSKVSKIETGKQMPTREDILAWASICRADAATTESLVGLLNEAQGLHREWKQQIRLGQTRIQMNYDDLARRANVIRNAEIVYIPGLLQTAEYARRRIEENVRLHGSDPDEVEAATTQRMLRQQILYDTTKTFEFVLTEAVLRFLFCPPAAMLAQLDRLLGMTGMLHVKIGIIPFAKELRTVPQNSFIIFDEDLAVVETFVGEQMYHGDEAAAYAAAMDRLLEEAAYDADARTLILNAIESLRRSL